MVYGAIDTDISKRVDFIDGNLDLLGDLFGVMLCDFILQQLIRRAAFNALEVVGPSISAAVEASSGVLSSPATRTMHGSYMILDQWLGSSFPSRSARFPYRFDARTCPYPRERGTGQPRMVTEIVNILGALFEHDVHQGVLQQRIGARSHGNHLSALAAICVNVGSITTSFVPPCIASLTRCQF